MTSKSREIKFRQIKKYGFHYWGMIGDCFISPCDPNGNHDQYTGLNDRNGRDIYEGDIVRCVGDSFNGRSEPDVGMFQVTVVMCGWGYEFDWDHISGYECSTHIMGGPVEENGIMKQVTIIGNIHQNPEC